MNERFPQLFWGLTVVTIGLVIVGFLTTSAIKTVKRTADVVTVTGSARQTVQSDLVQWGASVYANAMTMQEGYAVLARYESRFRAFLRERHVPDSVIVFSGVSQRDMVERAQKRSRTGDMEYESKFIGYQLTQRFDIQSSAVDSIAAIARDITQLVGEGIPLNSEPPRYYYTRLNDLRVELLGEATKDARMRAEKIIGGAGGRIGNLRNARMGVFQVTAPNSRDVSDYGIYDTSTIEKDVTAVVSVTFSLE
ncbi:SIMPL domain-containing protein [bacterium]|nr:SIMPL domain-containing protein [bacterium]MBU1983052.1 SIMPL domain-containing protein [bacterium]